MLPSNVACFIIANSQHRKNRKKLVCRTFCCCTTKWAIVILCRATSWHFISSKIRPKFGWIFSHSSTVPQFLIKKKKNSPPVLEQVLIVFRGPQETNLMNLLPYRFCLEARPNWIRTYNINFGSFFTFY
jgi:hypothetical protein